MGDQDRRDWLDDDRRRVLTQLDHMLNAGRVTDEEAARLRTAATPAAFDEAMGMIRARHAEAKLSTAIASGRLSAGEADEYRRQLREGGHSRDLRERITQAARHNTGADRRQ